MHLCIDMQIYKFYYLYKCIRYRQAKMQFNNQIAYDYATDPRWDLPEMTELEYEVSIALLNPEKKALIEQEAEDLGCGCTLEQAYISLIETGVIRR